MASTSLLLASFFFGASLFLQMCQCQQHNVEDQQQQSPSQMYSLNLRMLETIWHRAAVMALLKLKAESLLASLPPEERLVFNQCSRDENGTTTGMTAATSAPIELAKCVSALIGQRDRLQLAAAEQGRRSRKMAPLEEPARPRVPASTLEGLVETVKELLGIGSQEKGITGLGEQKKVSLREKGGKRDRKREEEQKLEQKLETDQNQQEMNQQKMNQQMMNQQQKMEQQLLLPLEMANLRFGNEILKIGRRKRRQGDEEATGDNGSSHRLVHVDNLHELQRFWEMREFCRHHLTQMAQRNAALLRTHLPFVLRLRVNDEPSSRMAAAAGGGNNRLGGGGDSSVFDHVGQLLANFLQRKRRCHLSLLSPRFLSLLPRRRKATAADAQQQADDAEQQDWLLSPRLLSLAAPNDGFLPLASLAASAGGGGARLLNRILGISGAGRAIQRALEALGAERRQQLQQQVFPAVLELQRRERRWATMLDADQKRQLQRWGFAFLRSREQAELAYGREQAESLDVQLLAANVGQRHARLERSIHALAQLDEKKVTDSMEAKADFGKQNGTTEKFGANEAKPIVGVEADKAAAPDAAADADAADDGPRGGLKLLAPFAFANLAEGVALEALILSPHAFVSELLAPVALSTEVLSPRAFVAAILSPNALFARVMSPAAFRAEVLSPRALSPFVLSPEVMIAEVLSPRALEPRVLSPEAAVIKVLSPVFLSPRVLSPEQLAVLVLSPTILSPGVLSPEALTIEVISPHILSGGSEEEEQQEEEHEGHGHGVEGGHVHGFEGGHSHGIEAEHGNGVEGGQGHEVEAVHGHGVESGHGHEVGGGHGHEVEGGHGHGVEGGHGHEVEGVHDHGVEGGHGHEVGGGHGHEVEGGHGHGVEGEHGHEVEGGHGNVEWHEDGRGLTAGGHKFHGAD